MSLSIYCPWFRFGKDFATKEIQTGHRESRVLTTRQCGQFSLLAAFWLWYCCFLLSNILFWRPDNQMLGLLLKVGAEKTFSRINFSLLLIMQTFSHQYSLKMCNKNFVNRTQILSPKVIMNRFYIGKGGYSNSFIPFSRLGQNVKYPYCYKNIF